MTDSDTNYWAVCCNPDKYDMLSAIQELEEVCWTIDRGEPMPGDGILVWQAKGTRGRRGVIAIGEVIAPPAWIRESEEEIKYWRVPPEIEPAWRTRLRITRFPGLPLWEDENLSILSALNVAKARGGTVFKIPPEQWLVILELADSLKEIDSPLQKQVVCGQGTRLTPAERKAIELHAQSMAIDHFKREGFEVEDVSRSASYDLHCVKKGDVRRVEVKGTTGNGFTFFLTRNEVELAKKHKDESTLFFVRSIVINRSPIGPVASGGEPLMLYPWDITQGNLTPLQFEFELTEKQRCE